MIQMKNIPWGKLLISLNALPLIFGAWAADFNATHVFNPNWPPHAKFHNGQTMFFATFVGLLALLFLWRRMWDLTERQALNIAAIFSTIYFFTQFGAYFVPGMALRDPQFQTENWSIDNGQLYLAALNVTLVVVGYFLEVNRLKKTAQA